jgi:DNA-binding NarL/FixJ family response regulator
MITRLAIADDEATVRAGLRMLIEAEPDLEVVGEASDGLEVIEITRQVKPDVVLMDIRMPRLDGLSAARRLLELNPAPRVLMLTTFGDDENLFEALRAGMSGFLLKVSPPERLLEAIRIVAAGDGLIDPTVTRRVIEKFATQPVPPKPPPALENLTPRELEVLKLIARGLANSEIAGELVLSEGTVKTHVKRILMKLGLRDRVQAAVLTYESGIVGPGEA